MSRNILIWSCFFWKALVWTNYQVLENWETVFFVRVNSNVASSSRAQLYSFLQHLLQQCLNEQSEATCFHFLPELCPSHGECDWWGLSPSCGAEQWRKRAGRHEHRWQGGSSGQQGPDEDLRQLLGAQPAPLLLGWVVRHFCIEWH